MVNTIQYKLKWVAISRKFLGDVFKTIICSKKGPFTAKIIASSSVKSESDVCLRAGSGN